LTNIDSLYTTEITDTELEDVHLTTWIEGIISINAGQMIEQSKGVLHPVSFFPIIKIQNDIKHIQWAHNSGIGGALVNNLHEITIHINGSKNGNDLYSKQMNHPIISSKSISSDDLINFIQGCKGDVLNRINLIGNPFGYENFSKLYSWIMANHLIVNVYIHWSDFILNKQSNELKTIQKLNVICDDSSDVSEILDICNKQDLTPHFIFLLTSQEDYDKTILGKKRFVIDNYEFVPIFNGHNIPFFEEYVFTTIHDFSTINLSKQDIFARQVINTNFFGRLIILPNGNVFANLNHPAIGTIYDPPYNLFYKEMIKGTTWRMTRKHFPCLECIFQWLCPPPSNYELVFERFNLCDIK
jgi:pseudo-rSAM protein